ncbi:MAG: hydrogenase maturation protease [Candidatus Eisenbacteria bacterium]|nr:hydrogenase maturation protease [Candidatus Eisenbacteria bacterium]MCC7141526.1 hydrogenase maturation protease [Candidatus Eisenbacteria bacterium]
MLVVAIGNPWRGDDGAARAVGELLATEPGITVRPVLQLTPELAAELAREKRVVFVDADRRRRHASLERMNEASGAPRESRAAVAHEVSIDEVVTTARRLFDFEGEVWLCRVPAHRFRLEVGLSPSTAREVGPAAAAVRALLYGDLPERSAPRTTEGANQAGASE